MKRLLKPFYISLFIGFGTGILVILLSSIGFLKGIEMSSYDMRFLIRGDREKPPPEIVIVAIDEESFNELKKRWQEWSRADFAKVIATLGEWGAKVVGVDLVFPEPSKNKEDDIALAEATASAKNVIHAGFFTKVEDRRYSWESFDEPLPLILSKGGGFGFINIQPEADGFVRRYTLLRKYQDKEVISFALNIVGKYLDLDKDEINFTPRAIIWGRLTVPCDRNRNFLINFQGTERTFETIPFYQVYERIASPKKFKDKIVLIGPTAETLQDVYPTPFFRETGKSTPGVEIHANAIYTMLYKDFLYPLKNRFNYLVVIILGLITSLINYRSGFLKGLFLSLGEIFSYVFLAILLFIYQNIILEIFYPTLVIFLTYGGIVLYRGLTEEREKKRIRSVFHRYVTKQVVEEILDNPEAQSLGGKRREVTILFSDIRGFTTMSEKMAPEEVVEILNEYLTAMVGVIFKYEGTLDKFIGDAIMAIFGAPVAHPDDAERGVKAAMEMHQELNNLKKKWEAEGKKGFDIGIGINTGEVVVGNIGSPERTEYTAIGDNVNLASRLESLNKEYKTHILISQSTYEKVKNLVEVRPIEPVQVKGKTEKIMIYELLGIK